MPSPLSLRDEAAQAVRAAVYAETCRSRRSAGQVTTAEAEAAADAVLGVLTTHIQQLRPTEEALASARSLHPLLGSGYNNALDDVLAVLGVAPTTHEPPAAHRCEVCGHRGPWPVYRCEGDEYLHFCTGCASHLAAASLPTHDQEQPQ